MSSTSNLRELVVIPKDRYERLLVSRTPMVEEGSVQDPVQGKINNSENEADGKTTVSPDPLEFRKPCQGNQECINASRKKKRKARRTTT